MGKGNIQDFVSRKTVQLNSETNIQQYMSQHHELSQTVHIVEDNMNKTVNKPVSIPAEAHKGNT